MDKHKQDREKDKPEEKDPTRQYDKEYPENGNNNSAGKEEDGTLPNRPAKNAERKAPEEDQD